MRRSLILAIVLTTLSCADAVAGRPGWFFSRRSSTNHIATQRAWRVAPSYQQTYHSLNARYPKYIGAFHASYFRDIGVPPGDVGLRGNGLYAFPW